MEKKCILEENKICDNCCECYVCELDPQKICDGCAKCLNDFPFADTETGDTSRFDENIGKISVKRKNTAPA